MPLSNENIIIRDKILAGIRKARRKLLDERATKNDTVVISVNGIPQNIPAQELLKALPR